MDPFIESFLLLVLGMILIQIQTESDSIFNDNSNLSVIQIINQ